MKGPRHVRTGVVVLMLSLAGCKASQDIGAWVDQVSPLKSKVDTASDVSPYLVEQQQTFKQYFSTIEDVAVRLAQDPSYVTGFNAGLQSMDLGATCAKVFVSRVLWKKIMNRCLKQGFFICSDEVRYYPDLLQGIRAKLTAELQQKFDHTPECESALH